MKVATNDKRNGDTALMGQKYCGKCDTVKPIDDFGKSQNRKNGIQDYCKPCLNAYHRSRRVRKGTEGENKTADMKAYQAEYRKKWLVDHPDYYKEYRAKRRDHLNAIKRAWVAKKRNKI